MVSLRLLLLLVFMTVVGMGAAIACRLPPGVGHQVYGAQAFPNQPYQTGTIFSWILDHSKSSQAAADRTVEPNVTPAKATDPVTGL
jgi:hypothetical protein